MFEITIKENAVFIADSHFKKNDYAMIDFFKNLHKDAQIFLMGDIFHALMGNIKTSININKELIDVILNLENDIIYLAGNHDFYVDRVFKDSKNIHVFMRNMQPLVLRDYKNNICILAHGDKFIGEKYERYICKYDSFFIMQLLKLSDIFTFGIFTKFVTNKIYQKDIKYFSFDNRQKRVFALKRIELYKKNILKNLNIKNEKIYIIEGHFHLGFDVMYENIHYVGLDCFYLSRKIDTFKMIESKNSQY